MIKTHLTKGSIVQLEDGFFTISGYDYSRRSFFGELERTEYTDEDDDEGHTVKSKCWMTKEDIRNELHHFTSQTHEVYWDPKILHFRVLYRHYDPSYVIEIDNVYEEEDFESYDYVKRCYDYAADPDEEKAFDIMLQHGEIFLEVITDD